MLGRAIGAVLGGAGLRLEPVPSRPESLAAPRPVRDPALLFLLVLAPPEVVPAPLVPSALTPPTAEFVTTITGSV